MEFQSFSSFEDMMTAMQTASQAADEEVEAWQAELKVGDFFLRLAPEEECVIYGEILDPSIPQGEGVYDEEARAEILEQSKIYEEPHMKGYRFTRCFSILCPEGELGDIHVSVVSAKVTKELFEEAQQRHWPVDVQFILDKLGTV